MLTLRRVIPALTARTAAGETVRAWDFKQKKNLLIAFLHSDCPQCASFAAHLTSRADELVEREAVALLVGLKPPRETGRASPHIIPAWDPTGRAAQDYLGPDALGSSGLARVALFVADRYGELFAQWKARDAEGFPPIAEAFKWLSHTQILCEECGVPPWQADE
jgi:hypothetical protein